MEGKKALKKLGKKKDYNEMSVEMYGLCSDCHCDCDCNNLPGRMWSASEGRLNGNSEWKWWK